MSPRMRSPQGTVITVSDEEAHHYGSWEQIKEDRNVEPVHEKASPVVAHASGIPNELLPETEQTDSEEDGHGVRDSGGRAEADASSDDDGGNRTRRNTGRRR